jgi:simple sugar transport system permease protein
VPIAPAQAWLSVTLHANQIVTGIGINILVLSATTFRHRELLGHRSRVQIPASISGNRPACREAYLWSDLRWYSSRARSSTWLSRSRSRSRSFCASRHSAWRSRRRRRAGRARQIRRISAQVRYGAVLFTGVMSAMAGCFLSIGDIHTFTEGMTNGAGYLALAAVIFGNWRIGRMMLACLFFGAATALQFQLPAMGIQVPTALLIMLPYLMALIAVGGLVGRQTAPPYLTRAYVR